MRKQIRCTATTISSALRYSSRARGRRAPRAFISNYQELGYLKNGRLVVLGPKRRVEMYAVRADGSAQPVTPDPALEEEAAAWYQTAFRAFKNGELRLH